MSSAQFLRRIQLPRWASHQAWIGADIGGEPITDFKTTNNTLSLFLVPESNSLGRVIAAIAATREKYQFFDYAIFESSAVEKAGLQLEQTPGDTADDQVNEWHWNLKSLTGLQLIKLAKIILDEPETNRTRVPKPKIEALISEGLKKQHLNQDRKRCSKYTLEKHVRAREDLSNLDQLSWLRLILLKS